MSPHLTSDKLIALRKDLKGKGLLTTLSETVDKARLSYYERCAEKAEGLRYKLEDPAGYESDELVRYIDKCISRIERKVKKGKTLKQVDQEILASCLVGLTGVGMAKKGRRHAEVPDLLTRMEKMIPNDS